jgi:hypothetical protein
MSDRMPPPWERDPLSAFMSEAEHNTRVSSLKWPDVYEVQQRAHGLLLRVAEAFEHDRGDVQHLVAARMLLLRSHAAMLGTMRLAMSGQVVEAQAVLRVAIENAWYALHIAHDPAPPARARIWWGRGDTPEATQACLAEFRVGHVRSTHEGLDAATAAAMQRLYDDAIAFGGHPNQGGVAMGLRIDERGEETARIAVGFLYPDKTLAVLSVLKAAVDVATGLAKIVNLIYPERFRIASLDEEVNGLIRRSAEVFGARAEEFRREDGGSARPRPN